MLQRKTMDGLRPRWLRLCGLLAIALALILPGCGKQTEVKFGVVLPLTGDSAVYGVPVKNGVELAYTNLQESKDFKYDLELDIRDSQSDPERAAALLEELFSGDALAALGGVTSDEALAMVDVADKYDRILLSPTASSPNLSGISKNFFRVFPSDFLEGSKMGNFATQDLELETVVVMAAESLYGRGIQEVFRSQFESFGGEVLEVIEYPPNTREFSGLVDRVITLNPQAVYIADFGNPTSLMVRELRDRGFKGRILTTSAFASPEVLVATGQAAEGIFLTQPVFERDSDDPQIQAFVSAYQEAYGEKPGLFAAHGYDALLVMARALERASRPTPPEFWKGMRGIRDFQGVTGTIQFTEKGDVQKYPRVYLVENGVLVGYERWIAEKRDELRRRQEELRRRLEEVRRGEGGS